MKPDTTVPNIYRDCFYDEVIVRSFRKVKP